MTQSEVHHVPLPLNNDKNLHELKDNFYYRNVVSWTGDFFPIGIKNIKEPVTDRREGGAVMVTLDSNVN